MPLSTWDQCNIFISLRVTSVGASRLRRRDSGGSSRTSSCCCTPVMTRARPSILFTFRWRRPRQCETCSPSVHLATRHRWTAPAMWDWLAYLSLIAAVAYAAFVLWRTLRGSFDVDDDQR